MPREFPDESSSMLDGFDLSWREGKPPSIEEVLKEYTQNQPSLPPEDRNRLLVDLIKIDMSYVWSSDSDQRPLLESYLEQFPDIKLSADLMLDLMVQEFRARCRRGDQPSVDEYAERFHEVSPDLGQRLPLALKEVGMESTIKLIFSDPESDIGEEILSPKPEPAELSPEAKILAETLARIQPFSKVTRETRKAIASRAKIRHFEPGELLLRQGEVANSLIIILEGVAEVTVVDRETTRVIARVRKHEVMGELGLLTQEVRSANVTALHSLRAAIISRDDYEWIAMKDPRLSIAFSELIAERVGSLTIDVLCGKIIAGYLVERRLGRGSMGIVYEAFQRDSQRLVALKMLRHDFMFDRLANERFHREAEFVKLLLHPNIIPVYDEFSAYGTCFIAMQLCQGPTLSQFIKKNAPLSEETVRRVTGQLAAALLHAHNAGIAHRDLKPSNVMIDLDGVVKLTDFGLARYVTTESPSLTAQGQILGTPRYMAPEQIGGDRGDKKSDLYSLGCVVYEMIAGHPIFQARRFNELLRQRFTWSLPKADKIRDKLDRNLYRLLCGCLTDMPEDRQVDLEEIAQWAQPIDSSLIDKTRDKPDHPPSQTASTIKR